MGPSPNSLSGISYMLKRSFFADTFGTFWKNWNPLFSYYLLYFCYRPLRTIFPHSLSIIFTFAVSGFIHDLAASMIRLNIICLFTPTFTLFGIYIIIENFLDWNINSSFIWLKPIYHVFLIVGMFFTAKYMMSFLSTMLANNFLTITI